MNAYQQLRQRAKQARDESIRDAQSLYKQAIRRIELLEKSLGGGTPKQALTPEPVAKALMALMLEKMPQDRAFTSHELVDHLRRAFPEREIVVRTVRTYLHRMAISGDVRRVCKARGQTVQWAARDCPVESVPDEAAALTNVCDHVLRQSGPMTLMDLTMAVQKRGTRPGAKPRSLMESLRRAMCQHQGRFVKGEGGQWNILDK
jgi:hypothetical protein